MTCNRQAVVAHIIFRFDYGGLENGVINVINGLSDESMRHVVIALTEATEFAARLKHNTPVHNINKQPGKDIGAYWRLYKLLRRVRPDIVHTRNMGTLDCQWIAFLARVPVRIHGEHGWDTHDPDGTNRKYRLLRKAVFPFVHEIVSVSMHLKRWLVDVVGVSPTKVRHICNGVDSAKFIPDKRSPDKTLVVGSITRFSKIKDPLNLVEAFIAVRGDGLDVSLLMVGDGELYLDAVALIDEAHISKNASLPGSRDDVVEQFRRMDVFALGSLREGISNTILEAMACGLPIIASDTGGNPELVQPGVNGTLVRPGGPASTGCCNRWLLRERRPTNASRRRVTSSGIVRIHLGRND